MRPPRVARVLTRYRSDEAGTSLAEMSVAMLIFGILSVMVMYVVLSVVSNANGSTRRFDNLDDAQPVMDVLTRDIRAASTVVSASPTSLTVDAALGASGGATQVTFSLAPTGKLTETDVADSGTGSSFSRVMSSHIVYPGTGGTPLFSFFDVSGDPLTAAQAASNPTEVAGVAIDLQDNESVISYSTVTLEATVYMRYAEYNA